MGDDPSGKANPAFSQEDPNLEPKTEQQTEVIVTSPDAISVKTTSTVSTYTKFQEFSYTEKLNFLWVYSYTWVWNVIKSIFNPFLRFPILKWLPKYKWDNVQGDLIAGITVGMTLIPQGLAYGQQAGLPPYYGLYSCFLSPALYGIMGGSKDVSNGPAAIMSSLVATFAPPPTNATLDPNLNPQYAFGSSPTRAILLAFWVGIFLLFVAIFQLSWIAGFVSHTMIEGFIQASAFTIPISQLKKITGQSGIRSETFLTIYDIFANITDINLTDLMMGLGCLIFLYAFQKLKEYCSDWNKPVENKPDVDVIADKEGFGELDTTEVVAVSHPNSSKKWLKCIGWFIGNLRNILVVVFASAIGYGQHLNTISPPGTKNWRNLTITGEVPEGLPPFTAPEFTETYVTVDDTMQTDGFGTVFSAIIVGIIICSILGYLEDYAIAKSFASKEKYVVDSEQEMYAMGVGNLLTGLTQGFPVTPSFSRCSINHQCGVMTPLAGVLSSVVVILCLLFLTQLIYWIPTACLGAIIVLATINLIKIDVIKHGLMDGTLLDRFTFLVTFCVCLYDTAWGIVIGTAVQLVFLVASIAFPNIQTTETEIPDSDSGETAIEILIYESKLAYPMTTKLVEIQNKNSKRVIYVNMATVVSIDNSAALAVVELVNMCQPGSGILFAKSRVKRMLMKYGLKEDKLIHAQ